jgi:tRNA(Arg) A34 adenosine deaminase TadA
MSPVSRVIELACQNVEEGGRPFATVITKNGQVVAESANRVAQTGDPTAHAEIFAISAACTLLGSEHLTGCTIYVLANPCPMCLGALYYCSPDEVVFLVGREEYEPYYTDDRKYFELSTFYGEYAKDWPERRLPMRHEPVDGALDVFRKWQDRNGATGQPAALPGVPVAGMQRTADA